LLEAQAFLRWLQTEWPHPEWTWCLPTEDMWELSARSPTGFLYPWGNDFLSDHCNCSESGLHTTSNVHAFEQGRSKYGCADMAGNVWEFVAATDSPSQGCVLRGGSYKNTRSEIRSHLRLANVPETHRPADFGFRCAQVVGVTATGHQKGGARRATNKKPLKKKSAKKR
jgi:formylglycine-generating enzyme required for sulfatase activity